MKTQKNNLIVIVMVFLIAAYLGLDFKQKQNTTNGSALPPSTNLVIDDQQKIMQAYQQQRSNIQVQAQGTIKAILPDDNQGSRHQKMILQFENGLTVLIAHNIDLAPKIEGLKKGDKVEFYGEYEYTDQGGVVHWTHHDPAARHQDGYILHQNQRYQ